MSADYRHSGVGWPTGAADLSAVFSLPSPNLLMLSTEGRYWHDEAVRAGKRVLWRAVPRLGKRPAELKWSPARFLSEALNLTDEPTLPIRDFVFGNELDLAPERGDDEDDWSNLENRYALIGGWAYSLIPMLRQALPGARLHWPAFTPDHDAIMWADHWRASADLCDVIDFHAYDSLDHIQNAYHDYRNEFPTKPLALTEWHCKGDLDEECRVLQWLAETMAVDPMFEAAYFFIWRWWDHPGWWSDSWDIEHTPARLALFRDPPTAAIAEPPPPPMPDPPPPEEPPSMTRDEIIALIVQKANEHGLVPWELLGGAIAESGLDPTAWRQGDWPDWSAGLYQQTVLYAEEGDHTASLENVALIKSLYFDPGHACDVAAVQFKYWRYNPDVPALTAWVAYNGPSYYHTPEQSPNVENYRESLLEARLILGIAQPGGDLWYGPDVPDGVILQQNAWSCAVRSTYAALWAMAQVEQTEPVTYGDGGPRDVYDWMVPTYDDPSVGLHAADGSGLVAMLAAHGYQAGRMSPAALSDAQARAGRQPVLIGGRAWNHWVYVRGLEADGTLILENPSPGFAGINGELRDSWDRLGPFTVVWIDLPADGGPEMEGDVTKAEADALRAENQHLRDIVGYLTNDVAAAIQKELDVVRPSIDSAQAAVNTLKNQAA